MKKFSKKTIDEINRLKPDELEKRGALQKARYGHICPDCQNGAGEDGTGITPIKGEESVVYHCFKCGRTFSNLQILKSHYDIENFAELVEKICADFDIAIEYSDFDAPKGRRKQIKRHDEKPLDESELKFIKEDLETSSEPLIKYLDAVKTWRGLPKEILLDKFNCRLIWQWTPPSSRTKNYIQSPRMIIPCSDEAYLARMLLKPNLVFSKPNQREFFKGKEKMHAGHKRLFNSDALTSKEPMFVVEGYIDAMSIDYAGFPCVALGSATRGDLLVDIIAKRKNKPLIIILFDPDTTGRENAPKLKEELIGDCCPAVIRYLDDGDSKIDCNDILVKEGVDALRDRLADIVNDSVAELAAIAADFDKKKETRLNDSDLNSLFKGNNSDLTFAGRLETFCGLNVRWLTDLEKWLLYGDGVWKLGSENNSCVAHFGRSLAEKMTQYAINNTEKDLAEKFQSAKKISAAITLLKTYDSIRITADDLDNHTHLLNCLNGVVDLQTGILYPHIENRLKLITQQCRVAIHKDAKSELVNYYLETTFPDEGTRAGSLRWLGYCVTGETSEERFAIWQGGGGNGKGVLSKTILYLLGAYAVGLPSTALLRNRKNFDANVATTALNALEKARFAISEELPLDSELDSALVKNLTGGDAINLRRNYGEYRTIQATAKINLSGNFLPRLENTDDKGLKRRMINIPFTAQFGEKSEHPADRDLKKKMLLPENLSALALLIVREAKNWYRGDGLIISDAMKQETARHLAQNDFIADFVTDNYVRVATATVKAKDFLAALRAEYPRETERYRDNDLRKRITDIDGITYGTDNHNNRVFKGIGKLGSDFDGKPVAPDDMPPTCDD